MVIGCGFGPGPSDFDALLSNRVLVRRSSAHEIRICKYDDEYFTKKSIPSSNLLVPAKVVGLKRSGEWLFVAQDPYEWKDGEQSERWGSRVYWKVHLEDGTTVGPCQSSELSLSTHESLDFESVEAFLKTNGILKRYRAHIPFQNVITSSLRIVIRHEGCHRVSRILNGSPEFGEPDVPTIHAVTTAQHVSCLWTSFASETHVT